jgi:hypothetical protein
MDVQSPVRSVSNQWKPLTRRPSSLRGARIGVLDNSKPNADVLLGRLAELLVERHGAASITRWKKPGSSRPAGMVDEVARGSDVVLTGSGD